MGDLILRVGRSIATVIRYCRFDDLKVNFKKSNTIFDFLSPSI